MILRIVICFLLLSSLCSSQIPKPSRYEMKWAFFHPFAALKVKNISKKCNAVANASTLKIQLDSFTNGGKADAYRHGFFMAAYAQKIKVRKLRKLGEGHEKNNYRQFLRSKTEEGERPDSLGSVMDLKNNEFGFTVGSRNKKIPLEDLSQLIIMEIQNGKAIIIKRDNSGHYLTCDGKKIDLNLYKEKWSLPKCLIASN